MNSSSMHILFVCLFVFNLLLLYCQLPMLTPQSFLCLFQAFHFILFLFCMFVCFLIWGVCRWKPEVLRSLGLDLQVLGSCLMWVLESKLGPSAGAAHTSNHWAIISPALQTLNFNISFLCLHISESATLFWLSCIPLSSLHFLVTKNMPKHEAFFFYHIHTAIHGRNLLSAYQESHWLTLTLALWDLLYSLSHSPERESHGQWLHIAQGGKQAKTVLVFISSPNHCTNWGGLEGWIQNWQKFPQLKKKPSFPLCFVLFFLFACFVFYTECRLSPCSSASWMRGV